mmetsp:Transcript_94251/g.282611  ORF Transcript_94251/g.282611 Transcript_94251/m.282611 type:complete len:375 (-) Transcript_94251:334-1458(-)
MTPTWSRTASRLRNRSTRRAAYRCSRSKTWLQMQSCDSLCPRKTSLSDLPRLRSRHSSRRGAFTRDPSMATLAMEALSATGRCSGGKTSSTRGGNRRGRCSISWRHRKRTRGSPINNGRTALLVVLVRKAPSPPPAPPHLPSTSHLAPPISQAPRPKSTRAPLPSPPIGPPSVEALQRWLRDPSNGSQDCPTDGIWGPATARALQNVLATKDITYTKVFCPFADGKFMFQAKVAMQAFLRVQGRAVNGESFKPYYKGAIDGAFGEASVKALKLWLNDQPGVTAVPIDGTIGQRTVRELQRLFNRTSNEFDLNFARNGVGRPDGRPRRNSNPEMQINAALAPLQLRPPMPGLPGPPGPPMPLPAAPPMPPPPARR